jgi:uncharacterized membrane protein
VVAPGLTVSEDETSELPTNGGCTKGLVGGDCYGGNIEVAPVSSMPLNPFGIMGVSICASSITPIGVPKILSWASLDQVCGFSADGVLWLLSSMFWFLGSGSSLMTCFCEAIIC